MRDRLRTIRFLQDRSHYQFELPRPSSECDQSNLCKSLIRIVTMKFTIVAAIFQVLLIILFATLVDYSDHVLPAHKGKEAIPNETAPNPMLPTNDVAVYYASKSFALFIALWPVSCYCGNFTFMILLRCIILLTPSQSAYLCLILCLICICSVPHKDIKYFLETL